MYKISDFIIPTRIIQAACRATSSPFSNLTVEFEEDDANVVLGIENGVLRAGCPKTLPQTFYNIVYAYLNNFDDIGSSSICLFNDRTQKADVLILTAGFLRSLSYPVNSFSNSKPTEPVLNRLYRWAPVWLIMKDLVCPVFQVPLKNSRVVSFNSPFVDTSIYADDKYMKENNIVNHNTPFIFQNTDIEYGPCANAALLLSAIRAHGLNPMETIFEIYNSELIGQLIGFSDIVFANDKKANDFISLLLTMAGIDNFSENLIENSEKVAEASDIIKYAQSWDQVYGNWWYLGLIERMLEPVRGSDWSTHQRLQPFLDELWNRVEKERKKRGRDGLNYESLLRVKDGEMDPRDVKLIEENLSSDRIW